MNEIKQSLDKLEESHFRYDEIVIKGKSVSQSSLDITSKKFSLLERALNQELEVELSYSISSKKRVRKTVSIEAFGRILNVWYLIAYCKETQTIQHLRIHGIKNVSLTGEAATVTKYAIELYDLVQKKSQAGYPIERKASDLTPKPWQIFIIFVVIIFLFILFVKCDIKSSGYDFDSDPTWRVGPGDYR